MAHRVAPLRLALLASALGLIVPLGCSALVEFGGLVGTTGDAGGSNAQTDAAPDAPVLADADTPTTDAGADPDAPFCPQSGVMLCDDFDQGVNRMLPGPWDDSNMGSSGTLVVQDLRYASQPSALLLKTDNTSLNVNLTKHLGAVKGAAVAFDVFIETRGGNLSIVSFAMNGASAHLGPGDPTYTTLGEGAFKPDGGYFFDGKAGTPIATGAWVHVVFDMNLAAATVTATVGASSAFKKPLVLGAWTGNALDVHLGMGDTNAATIYFDNVTITTR